MFGPHIWRYGRVLDPFAEMLRLRDQMNRIFSGIGQPVAAAYPAVNIWAGETGAVVTAELPGMDPEKIDISVLGDTLTIAGSREPEAVGEEDTYHRKERNGGSFTRTLQLPFRIDGEKIEARYEKGILTVTLPRQEADMPKKIAIKGK
ncbi:MAG TPA: Hsp20/alpha crystallin family protein [Syntrophales bacterium]|nr:Hsp20/alpha crystallin family protein [Syntrophales bacterium]HOM07918.1 Hsp20/alpha crystallin family protein [Syntrophales bacterium]HOO00354.1 Hsp20/alpha crystallin family protein [Syntrophales bacterium]HPC01730.1 Hsp20/alpha crystallin family protein [Syntrophales bacterium]HPQ06632.1 Hsp20/alpha crystallin family protein [Syntrophales bacterium]